MTTRGFPAAAHETLQNAQLRRNLGKATTTIREKRLRAVGELPDWEALRDAGAAIKARAMATLPEQLERLEASVTRAGGTVHWARDGAEANRIVASVARSHGAREVIKVKSIATDEIGLNDALAAEGISAIETDLAELILQLSNDKTSHILVPAIHRNRLEIKALFERTITDEKLGYEASAIAEAARRHLRAKFLSVPMAVSGANFGIAETGTVAVVESEGNGRMCTTLPKVLVTVMGIEKVLPEWRDLEVFLQLLPRSSTAERMNPYTSLWTGVREGDGPEEFHLVLLDGGRTDVLADELGRQALHCIRCSACLNVCPVYSRVGGQAYESVYPGPDRRGAVAAAVRARRAPDAPVGVLAVRRLLRRLPGQDRDPVAARAPARPRHPRAEVEVQRRGAGHADRGRGVRVARALRARAEAGPARARADRQGGAAGLDRDARAARAAEADVPGMVASRDRRPRSGVVSAAREAVLAGFVPRSGPAPPCPRCRARYRGPRRRRQQRRPLLRARGRVPRVGHADRGRRPRRHRRPPVPRARRAAGSRCRPAGRRRSTASSSWSTTRRCPPQALDQLDGVLTGCALAIAETGTIVLDGGQRSGRRALTLVPDWHVCIVEAGSVVAGVPDAVAVLAEAAHEGRPITLVSGPSATSDIELDRVEGVHGPRTLDVLVLEA